MSNNCCESVSVEEICNVIEIHAPGLQGPPGPSGGGGGAGIVDNGSFASPIAITASIGVAADIRTRKFITGNGGPVVNPTLGTGAADQELYLFGCSNTNTVELNSTTNLQLSGPVVLKLGTILSLQWITGLNKWVEVARNEI